MNKKTRKLFTWCLVVAMIVTQMLFTNVAFGATKLQGSDRYQTAAKIATSNWTTSDYAVLATGEDFPDALAAAPLAKAYDAPILLTDKAGLNSDAQSALTTLGVKNVIVVGGESVVSAAVVDALEALNITVDRVYGADRYATSVEVAKKVEAKAGTPEEVILATGADFADALSAAFVGSPILLTDKAVVSADVAAYIGTKKVYVVGGTAAVSDAVAAQFAGSERLAGSDRFATNLAINKKFAADKLATTVYLATGFDFPDALAGAAIAENLVLVGSSIDAATMSFLKEKVSEKTTVTTFGGLSAVASAAGSLEAAIAALVPGEFAVKSVTVLNAKQVAVEFNMDVQEDSAESLVYTDGDETPATYTITKVGSDAPLTIVDDEDNGPDLQDDKRTVVLTLADGSEFTNDSENYTFEVKGVLNLNGDEVDDYTTMQSVKDATRPSVANVSFSDSKTLTVEFSEPVKNADVAANITVTDKDGDTVPMGDPEVAADKKSVDLAVPEDGLDAGSYKVAVTMIRDFADNLITPNPTEKSVTYVEDETDPTIVSVASTSNKTLKVVFSEPLAEKDGVWFTLKVNGVDVDVTTDGNVVDNDDDKEFEVTLGDDFAGGLAKIEVNNYQDLAENLVDDASKYFINFDEVAPQFKSTVGVEKDINGVKYIVFETDRAVNVGDIDQDFTYVDDGVEKTVAGVAEAYDTDGGIQIPVADLPDGEYSFELKAGFITDKNDGTAMEDVDVTFTINNDSSDVEVVTVANKEGDPNHIIVTYTEESELGTSALNVNNYKVEGQVIAKSAKFVGNKYTVDLTLNENTVPYNAEYDVEITNIKDSDGNSVDKYNEAVELLENVKPKLVKAELTLPTEITLTFSEAINPETIGDAKGDGIDEDFTVYVNGEERTVTAITAVDENNKKFILTLADDDKIDNADLSKTIVVKPGDNDTSVKDENGNSLTTFTSVTVAK